LLGTKGDVLCVIDLRPEENIDMGPLKLLVVEDDIAGLELITEVLTSFNAEVHPISDGRKAADLVSREKFDGIFLDLEIPHLNGFELVRRIRKSSWNKSVPIIIVTGHNDKGTMEQVFDIGASFFLQKPVDRQKLAGLFRAARGMLVDNRRRNARVPLQTMVSCTSGSRTWRGNTWNLSSGGIQIEAGGLQPGDSVKLSFRLPQSGVTVEAIGNVIWAKQQREGIQFTHVSGQSQRAIQEFIAEAEKG
jgi:CheY-like chemotaxis protein